VIEDSPSGAPEQSLRWLRPFLPARLQPILRGVRKRWERRKLKLEEPFRTVYPFTQATLPRQRNLVRLGTIIEAERIPGAIVECGVLDGGTSALMAHATAMSGRDVHMFDSWQGLPETTSEDGQASKKWQGNVVGSPRRVARVMKQLNVDAKRLHFHVGWFEDTFPHANIPAIALLHIDCDFYEPTKLCLDTWYSKVVSGGFIQFDDYVAFVGFRTAVDEFLSQHLELRMENFGTGDGRACFLRKPQ
jgi:O-methyltransferase